MAAVLQFDPAPAPSRRPRLAPAAVPVGLLVEPFPVSARPSHPAGARRRTRPRPARRPADAVFRRRRLMAALVGLGLVLTVARAGLAIEGSSLATPERPPHVRTVVVEPGDSLWAIASRLAPGADPRVVVDALVRARGRAGVVPGEMITWLDT
jgi:Tfp pilus assembly protein FimV